MEGRTGRTKADLFNEVLLHDPVCKLTNTHLLNDGGEPAEREAVAVLPGDDGAAHLDDDPPRVLQLVPVEDGARALRRLEVVGAAQRDLVAVAVAARVGHGEGAELAADDIARSGLGGAGVEAAVEHPSLEIGES